VDRRAFERIVRDAIESLPVQFRHALENVAIVVLEEPDPDDLSELDLAPEDDELFGLYQGVPLTERGSDHMDLPDRIEIYRGPILRCCDSVGEIAAEIRDTLVHELGHHMGMDDDEMPY
jgi:predicted Zn-dependent protease with MMP-like domain